MKNFQFSLEVVLRVRSEQFEKTRQAFAECSQWRARAQNSILAAQAEIDASHEALTAKRSQRTTRADQILFLNSMQYQQTHLLRLKDELSRVERELEIRRQTMLAAQRKLDALENLKERKKEAHDTEVRRVEEAAMDDLIGARYVLSNAEVTK
jgi:flagellar export protein FliJ